MTQKVSQKFHKKNQPTKKCPKSSESLGGGAGEDPFGRSPLVICIFFWRSSLKPTGTRNKVYWESPLTNSWRKLAEACFDSPVTFIKTCSDHISVNQQLPGQKQEI